MLVGESITRGPPSTSTITYTYNSLTGIGTANPATFTVPLSWSLGPGHTGVKIVSWISSNGFAGLSAGGGNNIPAANFFESSTDAQGNFNNTLSPCNGTTTFAGVTGFVSGGGCTPGSILIVNTGNNLPGDTLTFTTALQGLSSSLTPGGYTATLFFQAVTF